MRHVRRVVNMLLLALLLYFGTAWLLDQDETRSAASKVVDRETRHEQGTLRLCHYGQQARLATYRPGNRLPSLRRP